MGTILGPVPSIAPENSGGTIQIIPDDLMGLLIRVSQPAGDLFLLYRLRIR